ncbi:MAG TPA: antibiotic biosynthesis monooxygenase [Lentisphaeria bacterium]|nr:MAG: antibiotic biosynthesis monooxygenase [Lentisphaerae bacterium GWF2_38_69]HBM14894.1 antibiotic biosynthesis monooxygenase [Lentisphaeria bacterium]
MVTTIVHIKVKQEFVKQFIEATTKNHANSVKEKGNMRFDFLQNPTDPTAFILYEAYETEEDAKTHKTTTHYEKWRTTVEPFMASRRIGLTYKVIKP